VTPSEVFMTDGGPHFDNNAVRDFCQKHSCRTHITPMYSPWVNGLVKGTNKLLLHVLKRMCAPDLNDDEYDKISDWKLLPANWPLYFDEAVNTLNRRILPALKFSPKELLLGLAINTPKTNTERSTEPMTSADVFTHMVYAEQQQLDGYAEAVAHAMKWKSIFDRKVEKHGEVVFQTGDLVQVYRSDFDYTFQMECKLLPKWSRPHRVASRNVNSYYLETTEGKPIDGVFSARRLRRFEPKEGSKLDLEQKAMEERRRVHKIL
ncbi:hypothetical protein H0H92_007364, partial [Tricholoma furcatifolium]